MNRAPTNVRSWVAGEGSPRDLILTRQRFLRPCLSAAILAVPSNKLKLGRRRELVFWRKKDPEDYIDKKQYQKAIALYREKLKDQPKNTALRMNIADTLVLDKDVDQAILEYKKIADLQTEQGFILKAIAVYKKVLKIQPENEE